MLKIISIIILLIITIVLMYLTIKLIVFNLSNKIKRRLNREIAIYDKLIEEKELTRLVKENQIIDNNVEKVIENTKYIIFNQEDREYLDDNFKEKYKKVKENYANKREEFNNIKKFVDDKNTEKTEEYLFVDKLLNNFNSEKIISIYMLEEEKQKKIIMESIKENPNLFEFSNEESFDLLDFIELLKVKRIEYDNNVYLYGTKEYEGLCIENLIYIFDENIIEGYNLKYKNKLYKYSFE